MKERPEERLSLLPMIGERFGEWFEAHSYEEGVGVDGELQDKPCINILYEEYCNSCWVCNETWGVD